MQEQEKRNVYVTLNAAFARERAYTDPATGERRTFWAVTMPKGTVIEGRDVGGYEFKPLFVNPAKYAGEGYVDVPLRAGREVWLQKTVFGPDGEPVRDARTGRVVKDTVKATPAQVKAAVDLERREYLSRRDERPLGQRAASSRESSAALSHGGPCGPQAR